MKETKDKFESIIRILIIYIESNSSHIQEINILQIVNKFGLSTSRAN